MTFPSIYNCLSQNQFVIENFKLVSIRYEDRLVIMNWRNEQIFHLRQDKPLTEAAQEDYFKNTLANTFNQKKPNQILFSFLKDGICIGYGGLVHINWIDKNAEISFIMNTELEKKNFIDLWKKFLGLIEKVAFQELNFHKIYTHAFDVRPKLYTALELAGFTQEAVLKDHCYISKKFEDVIIHSKWNGAFGLKEATFAEKDKTYYWLNHDEIRKFSFNKNMISYEHHISWYSSKINDKNCVYLMAFDNNEIIGSIRFDLENVKANASYLVDPNWFGKGYGTKILKQGILKLQKLKNEIRVITGSVMKENEASLHIFRKLNFKEQDRGDNYFFTLNI